MVRLTDHSEERLKERCGLPKKALLKHAQRAFDYGLSHKECSGRLRKYIDYLFLSHEKTHANNIKLYGNHVFIFSGACLITVLNIPSEHLDAVLKIKNRRDKKGVK